MACECDRKTGACCSDCRSHIGTCRGCGQWLNLWRRRITNHSAGGWGSCPGAGKTPRRRRKGTMKELREKCQQDDLASS